MVAVLRNRSGGTVSLPYPFRGVLPPGGSSLINATAAAIFAALGPTAGTGLEVEDLSVSSAEFDTFRTGGLLGGETLSSMSFLDFDALAADPTHTAGRMFYRSGSHSLMTDAAGVTIKVGEEEQIRVVNKGAAGMALGLAVSATGATGDRANVEPADNTDASTIAVLGLTSAAIAKDDPGRVTAFGLVRGLNTNAWSVGDILYVGTAGALTNVRPVAAAKFVAEVGVVIVKSATVGVVFVKPSVSPVIADITANRPTAPRVGEVFFDTTLGYAIWWNGAAWVEGTLADVTANRPAAPFTGQIFFDTTLGKPIWWSGAAWVDATGAPIV